MCADEQRRGPRFPDPPETVRESATELHAFHDLGENPVEIQASAGPTTGGVASYHEFASALIEIGLTDAAELERCAADSADGVLGLSRSLVKAGKLTPYQAAAVYQKKSRGLLVGDYLILDKVGQGGMGLVFKARHRKLGRVGALKILPPSFARDRGAVMRFRREFEAAGRLKHLNLVAAFEADEDRGVHFLVMDFVDGLNLDRVVRQQGPLPIPVAVDYLIQSARGLEAAHEQGIIHRDIKPGNLMLDRGGTIRVLDLGLARIVDASNPFSKTGGVRLTQSGTYMGTIDYMAPEQAEDAHQVDHRADIYGLGCTFFFLLTGREPFSSGTILKRMMAHQEHPAPSLRSAGLDVAPALEAAYQKMMAKRPDDRPASMTEVIALFQASKLANDKVAAKMAPTGRARPASDVVIERPPKRADLQNIAGDSSIFAPRAGSQGLSIDHELNLRDLVMDVRSDAGATADTRVGGEDSKCGLVNQDVSLRDLMMELRDDASPPEGPKRPSTDMQQADRPASGRHDDAPFPVPKSPFPKMQSLKSAELTPSPSPLSSNRIAILTITAVTLLVVAVALFVSFQPTTGTDDGSAPPLVGADVNEDPVPPAPP